MRGENNKKMEVVEFDRDLGNLYLRSSGIWLFINLNFITGSQLSEKLLFGTPSFSYFF